MSKQVLEWACGKASHNAGDGRVVLVSDGAGLTHHTTHSTSDMLLRGRECKQAASRALDGRWSAHKGCGDLAARVCDPDSPLAAPPSAQQTSGEQSTQVPSHPHNTCSSQTSCFYGICTLCWQQPPGFLSFVWLPTDHHHLDHLSTPLPSTHTATPCKVGRATGPATPL